MKNCGKEWKHVISCLACSFSRSQNLKSFKLRGLHAVNFSFFFLEILMRFEKCLWDFHLSIFEITSHFCVWIPKSIVFFLLIIYGLCASFLVIDSFSVLWLNCFFFSCQLVSFSCLKSSAFSCHVARKYLQKYKKMWGCLILPFI